MGFALGPGGVEAGYGLAAFETIGSTSDEAMARARDGTRGPLWVVSARQTSGRGRRGRTWETPRGNLAASLLLTLDIPPHRAATLGFVAGLALSDALEAIAPALQAATALDGASGLAATGGAGRTRLALKWPNDVVADGAKVAGIMLESESVPRGSAVVIGIGVNVVAGAAGAPYPTASLAGLGVDTSAEALFTKLSEAWIRRFAMWSRGSGLAAIRDAWLTRAAGIGGPVAVQAGSRVVRGTFETLDEEGRLIVREADGGRIPIAAGEVHFGTVASLPAAG